MTTTAKQAGAARMRPGASWFGALSLNSKLLASVFAVVLVVVLLLSCMQIASACVEQRRQLAGLQKQIELTAVDAIASSLFRMDSLALAERMAGVSELPGVAALEVVDSSGRVVLRVGQQSSGLPSPLERLLFGDYLTLLYDLRQTGTQPAGLEGATPAPIGELKLIVDHSAVWAGFLSRVLNSVVYIVVIAGVALVALKFALARLLSPSIKRISNDIRNIDLESVTYRPLEIGGRHQGDELGELCRRFNAKMERLFAVKERLEVQATVDPVTGLRNRSSLYEHLDQLMARRGAEARGFTALLIDLDNFKEINDVMGHSIGDIALAELSGRMIRMMNHKAQCFRLGGDEFVVVYDADMNNADLIRASKQLLEIVSHDVVVANNTFRLTGSIGAARYPGFATNRATLLKQCDMAMYHAKLKGGGSYSIYDPSMEEQLKQSAELAELIQWALDKQQFIPFYQPQIDVLTKQVYGYELLVRMRDPEGNIIEPNDFIPVAEHSRKILALGRLVFELGARHLKECACLKDIRNLSVNVSTIQLRYDEGLVEHIAAVLEKYGIAPGLIELEITENFLATDDDQRIVRLLQAVRKLGVRIALDDFGVGYSSLSRLKDLPVDTIKIDKTFVDRLPEDQSITATIIALAKNLQLAIVAEGVETEAQSVWLERHGCDYLQGYHYGRPQPLDL